VYIIVSFLNICTFSSDVEGDTNLNIEYLSRVIYSIQYRFRSFAWYYGRTHILIDTKW